jgi:hypothetical protein
MHLTHLHKKWCNNPRRDRAGTPPSERPRILVWVFFRALFRRLILRFTVAMGVLYNWAGIPGLVRDCDYDAGVTDAHIKVRVGELYTIVSVNGLDIYFDRLSGSIDGVGTSAIGQSVLTRESVPPRELFGPVPPQPPRT